MTAFYPNPCYNEVHYNGSALYLDFQNADKLSKKICWPLFGVALY